MARPLVASSELPTQMLHPLSVTCRLCDWPAHIAYHTYRTVMTLSGGYRLRLAVRRCQNPECTQYHRPYRPEEEGRWALPHGEYGLDVIALVGMLRYRHHHSLAELHQALRDRGISMGERTVLNLLARYEELVSIHLANQERLHSILSQQAYVVLALDGLRPDVGHEVLWCKIWNSVGGILTIR